MANNRLRQLREENGISQTELAKRTGLSRATISKIENSEQVSVTLKTIAKIADVFGVPASDIFTF